MKFLENINRVMTNSRWISNRKIYEQTELYKTLVWDVKHSDKIFIVGNGGSNAISEHIATDLFKRCDKNVITLSNNSLLTCLSNDYGYENALVKFLNMYDITPNDLLIVISSSGKSKNILNVLETYKHCKVVFIHGFSQHVHTDKDICYHIYLPSDNYGVIEMASEIILHSIVEDIVQENLSN